MANILEMSEQERNEIFEIAHMLKDIPEHKRTLVKGFLMGAEYAEQAIKENNK